MKKIIIVLVIVLSITSVLGIAYANDLLPLSKKQEIQRQILEFRDKIAQDVEKNTNISLSNYQRLDYEAEEEFLKSNKDVMRIIFQIKSEMKVGDFRPYVYVNEKGKHVYIVRKDKDGNNYTYDIQNKNGEWELAKVLESKGEILKLELE